MSVGWLRKLRGILGLGGIGAVLGAFGGAAWSLATSLSFGYVDPGFITMAATVWGTFGAFCGAGFGVALVAFSSRRSLDQLGVASSALIGGLLGAVFPLAFNLLLSGPMPLYLIKLMLPVMGVCAALGATLSTGMVLAAKRADRREVAEGRQAPALPHGSGTEE